MPVRREINYKPPPTLSQFMKGRAFHRGVMGPRGGGKSSACCNEIMLRALEQKQGPSGIRMSRFAIVRNTYRELEDTTLKTWLDWFPEEYFGKMNYSDMMQEIYIPQYKVQSEILFRALDRPKDIKKLLSLELTGAYVNEAREVPFGIIEGLGDAVGRYPARKDGGCTWRGIIMDTNAPDDTSWWYRLAEEEPQDSKYWQFFKQPGGLIERGGQFFNNPMAENTDNLEDDYYFTRMQGKKLDHIRVYYCNQYGFIADGKPVHEEYSEAIHKSPIVLEFVPGAVIYVGIDFGLTPAATFGQRLANGRWIIVQEMTTEHMGISRFADQLKPELNKLSEKGFKFEIYGDPAGSQEAQTDERTPFQILEAKGIPASAAHHNNDPITRREALYQPFTRIIDGKPGMIVSPACKTLLKGLAGGYYYKKVQVAGDERYETAPYKNQYSHVVEACEYMSLGAGEGTARQIAGGPKDYTHLHWNPRRRERAM